MEKRKENLERMGARDREQHHADLADIETECRAGDVSQAWVGALKLELLKEPTTLGGTPIEQFEEWHRSGLVMLMDVRVNHTIAEYEIGLESAPEEQTTGSQRAVGQLEGEFIGLGIDPSETGHDWTTIKFIDGEARYKENAAVVRAILQEIPGPERVGRATNPVVRAA